MNTNLSHSLSDVNVMKRQALVDGEIVFDEFPVALTEPDIERQISWLPEAATVEDLRPASRDWRKVFVRIAWTLAFVGGAVGFGYLKVSGYQVSFPEFADAPALNALGATNSAFLDVAMFIGLCVAVIGSLICICLLLLELYDPYANHAQWFERDDRIVLWGRWGESDWKDLMRKIGGSKVLAIHAKKEKLSTVQCEAAEVAGKLAVCTVGPRFRSAC